MVMDKEVVVIFKISKMKIIIYDELVKYEDIMLFLGKEDFLFNIIMFGIKGVWGEVFVYVFEGYDIFILIISVCFFKVGKLVGIFIVMGILIKLV